MKSYIVYSEALKLLDSKRCEEVLSNKADWLIDRSIENGMVFSIIQEGKVIVQKESIVNYFGNRGVLKNGITFEQDDIIRKSSTSFKHISTLKTRLMTDSCLEYYGYLRIDDIFADYHLSDYSMLELKRSLEAEGIYDILEGTCGYTDCCGRYVEVKHIKEDIIAWTTFYFQKEPVSFLEGYLFEEEDFQEFERLVESPNIEESSKEAEDMKNFKASKVLIVPPIYFRRKYFEELVKDYS
jgi:hypothetical protein